MGQETVQKVKNGLKKEISKAYNEYKKFEGKPSEPLGKLKSLVHACYVKVT